MPEELKTAFVPKKPIGIETAAPKASKAFKVAKSKPVSLISFLSIIIFLAALAAGGGVYISKLTLVNKIQSMAEQLERARGLFEPTLIERMQTLDKRINTAQALLSNHNAVSPLFELLEEVTIPTVQFTHFTLALTPQENTVVLVEMSGISDSYQSIARQSELFDENKYVRDQIFSNLTVDRKTGNVTFDLSFVIDRDFLMYSRTLI